MDIILKYYLDEFRRITSAPVLFSTYFAVSTGAIWEAGTDLCYLCQTRVSHSVHATIEATIDLRDAWGRFPLADQKVNK
jgi:hypothetical protein